MGPDLAVSVQVLQGFCHQATRDTRPGRLSHEDGLRFLEPVFELRVQAATLGVFRDVRSRYGGASAFPVGMRDSRCRPGARPRRRLFRRHEHGAGLRRNPSPQPLRTPTSSMTIDLTERLHERLIYAALTGNHCDPHSARTAGDPSPARASSAGAPVGITTTTATTAWISSSSDTAQVTYSARWTSRSSSTAFPSSPSNSITDSRTRPCATPSGSTARTTALGTSHPVRALRRALEIEVHFWILLRGTASWILLFNPFQAVPRPAEGGVAPGSGAAAPP